jgi:hypothetical protein
MKRISYTFLFFSFAPLNLVIPRGAVFVQTSQKSGKFLFTAEAKYEELFYDILLQFKVYSLFKWDILSAVHTEMKIQRS